MNDDARFFFCISGFLGFTLFLFCGLVITGDLVVAFVQSAFGCLFFAICGRFLLSFILNGNLVESKKLKSKSLSSENSSIPNDPSQLAKVAMLEASATANPMVQAKA